ncbi:hypothetical protein COHA_004738 [Chlorella ohadii]|uniref:Uncharacterized protein n=1 Tax=Chlorella ohadii TaxID=2649997 RepID=A0AAD5DS96_9CHLO|nr:hypothetical protein COHA_004738 [Chlorella ohadii]
MVACEPPFIIAQVAEENVESLTEMFFQTANAYLTMAQKEGNAVVTQHIETALRAALEAKQATLRPEIQLLNRLLGAETQEQRQRILFNPDAVDTLVMNDRYFFGLLNRMQTDVGRMPDGPQKAALVERLESIKTAADAAVAGA